jgi:hypothetical protein
MSVLGQTFRSVRMSALPWKADAPLCGKSGQAKGRPVRYGAKPSFSGTPLPGLGQRVTWIFIQGVAMCQTLLNPSPVTSPGLVSLPQV